MRMHTRKGFWAALLTIAMLLSFLTPSAFAVEATKTADADTRESYTESFGDGSSTRYDGRIWTDKSVSTQSYSSEKGTVELDDSDFLVTYSALATSTTVVTSTPVDVMFILDFSASMNWAVEGKEVAQGTDDEARAASRLQVMVDSLNEAFTALKNANPQNRVGVVVFNGGATEMLSLRTLENTDNIQNNQYFSITQFEPYESSSSNKREAHSSVKCNLSGGKEISTAGGTNIQSGLYMGMKMLANASNTEYDTATGTTVTRMPNVIVMSDGAPTTFSSATDSQYTDEQGHDREGAINNKTDIDADEEVSSGSWWNQLEPSAAIGSGDNNNPDSADGFMALLTASYWKDRITEHYYGTTAAEDSAKVYTIGFSTNQQEPGMVEMANLVLNPAGNSDPDAIDNSQVRAVLKAWESYSGGQRTVVTAPIGEGNNSTKLNYVVERADQGIDSLVYPDQYYLAENAQSLYDAFDDIIGQIAAQAKLPTEYDPMDPTRSGYLTYTDPIGQYMQVDTVKAILWNDILVTDPVVTESADHKTVTYTFEQEIQNPIYTEANNVNTIEITVETKEDETQEVRIRIPAAAIPLRVNTLTFNGDTLESNVCNNALPVRIFYTVSLKDGILNQDNIVDLNAVSEEYLQANTDSEGNLSFYTNQYSGATDNGYQGSQTDGVTVGDASVTFTPAQDNPFYYIQEDTPLYLDEALTTPATSVETTGTYYFQISYYEDTALQTAVIKRTGSLLGEDNIVVKENECYLKKGAPRLGNLSTFVRAKAEDGNATNTAAASYYPTYVADGEFKVYLGNNGQMKAPLPTGSLTITKQVSGDAPADATFTFTVNLKDASGNALTGTYSYTGSKTGSISDGGTLTLAAGQSVTITGLPNGTQYTVTEAVPDDYTVDANPQTGTISSGVTDTKTFTNTYHDSEPAKTVDKPLASPKETLTYTIHWVNDAKDDNGIAQAATVTITDQVPEGTDLVANSYEGATYNESTKTLTWTIQAAAGAEGDVSFQVQLQPSTTGTVTNTAQVQVGNDPAVDVEAETYVPSKTSSTAATGDLQVGDVLTYTISYKNVESSAATVTITDPLPEGLTYVDNSASNNGTYDAATHTLSWTLENVEAGYEGTVTFQAQVNASAVTTVENQAQVQVGNQPQVNTNPDEKPVAQLGSLTITKTVTGEKAPANASFTFQVEFEGASGSYSYTGSNGASGSIASGETLNLKAGESVTITGLPVGIKYTVTETNLPDGFTTGNASVSGEIEANQTASAEIINTYSAKEVTLPTEDQFQVTKTIAGREWQQGDSFTFTLTARDGAPMPAETTLTIDNTTDGHATSFGSITYTEAGTYVYDIKEQSGSAADLINDTHTATVTVVIGDNGKGQLTVDSVAYDNSAALTNNDKAVRDSAAFTNVQIPAVTLSGTKILEGAGHSLAANEFSFVLEKLDNGAWVSVGTASNGAASTVAGQQQANFAFDEIQLPAQAGDYKYLVSETQGSDGGVTYAKNAYIVTYTVSRDSDTGAFTVTSSIQAYATIEDAKQEKDPTSASAISFTNSYQAADASVQLTATKTMTGRNMTAGEFNFVAQSEDGTQTATGTNTADGQIIFSPALTFDQAGTYKYTIFEVNGGAPGVVYDTDTYTLSIRVTDNGNGGFDIGYSLDGDTFAEKQPAITFDNSYSTPETDLVLKAHKTLTNGTLAANQFSFSVYTVNADGSRGTKLVSGTNAADGSITFGGIGIDTAENRTYWIEEDDVTDSHITKQGDHYLVNVSVTDPQNGAFEIEVQDEVTKVAADGTTSTVSYSDGAGIDFTNVYKPTEAELIIPVTKTLTGRAMQANEFSFQLMPKEGNDGNDPVPAEGLNTSADASGQAAFNITYEYAGTYNYTVGEVKGSLGGVEYDETVYTIQVKVEDQQGTLTANYSITSGQDAIAFANQYTVTETSIQVPGSKSTQAPEGATPDGYRFSYGVWDQATQSLVTSATSDADGNFTINLTFQHDGDYTFLIGEMDSGAGVGDNPGIEYDDSTYTLNVHVQDNKDGTLTPTYTLTNMQGETCSSVDFNNIYHGGETELDLTLSLGATKELTGRDLADKEFSFVVKDESGNKVAAGNNNADGTITFGDLFYDEDDYGTHSYTVEEINPGAGMGPNGISYDSTVYSFTVEVQDNGDGTMSATYSGPESIVFRNSYRAADVQTSLRATKTLDGASLISGQFVFALRDEAGNLVSQVTNGSGEDVSAVVFPNLVFNADMMEGSTEKTFQYTISEVNTGKAGVTYDQSVYNVAITVRDDGTGALSVDAPVITLAGSPVTEIAFHNSYRAAQAALTLTGTKTLTGRDLADGEFSFTAELQQADGSWQAVAAAVNKGQTLTFSPITFEALGEYTLRVSENNSGLGGVQYDTSVYYLTVAVTDEGNDGQMDAAVTKITKGTANETGSEAAELAFANTYTTKATTATLTGTKTLTGRAMQEGEFSFTVYEGDTIVTTGRNQADGTIVFGTLNYTEAGTHNLTIRENKGGSGNGIVYDETEAHAVVTVTDDGKGTLTAAVSYPDGAIAFHNSYLPTETQVVLTGTKVLEGKALTDGEFSFAVLEGDTYVATGKNNADGSITFSPIYFGSDDVGEHTYTVVETKGGKAQITYDDTVYTVTVKVSDDGTGAVHADVTYPEGGLVFRNSYTPTPVQVSLQASKLLSGRTMLEGEFLFHVSDASGNVIADARNDARGVINFAPLTYTQAGDYSLTIWEETGSADNVTYDTTRFSVVVHVTDQNGVLNATVEYPEGGVVFHNAFVLKDNKDPGEDPTTPTPTVTPATQTTGNTIPQTSDNMPIGLIAVIAAVAAGAFLILLVLRKQKTGKK